MENMTIKIKVKKSKNLKIKYSSILKKSLLICYSKLQRNNQPINLKFPSNRPKPTSENSYTSTIEQANQKVSLRSNNTANSTQHSKISRKMANKNRKDISYSWSPQQCDNSTKKYGDYVFLNSVEKLLIDESAEVVFFTGQDTHLRIVLLGIGIIWQPDEISFVNLIKEFFQAMGTKPNCLITNDRKEIVDAIKTIHKKFKKDHKWNHLIYASAIKDQFQKKIDKDQDNFKNEEKLQFVGQFQDAIKQYSLQKYQSIMKGLKKKSKTEYLTEVVKKFNDEKRKYCYSQIYGTMCGFGLDDDRIETFQSCLKKNFEKGNFVQFFYFVFNYEKNYLTRVAQFKPFKNTKPIQSIALKILTQKIEGNIMNEILHNFADSKKMKVLLMKNNAQNKTAPLQTHYTVSLEKDKQIVKRMSKNDGWQCSCNYRNLTGVPCKHLLAVLEKKTKKLVHIQTHDGTMKEPWFAEMMKKKLELKIEEYLHDSYVDIQQENDNQENEDSGEDEQDIEKNVDQGFVPNGIIQLDPQLKNLQKKTKKEEDDDSMNSEDHFIAKALMEFQEDKD